MDKISLSFLCLLLCFRHRLKLLVLLYVKSVQNQFFPLFWVCISAYAYRKTNEELSLPVSLENVVELNLGLEDNDSLLFLSIDLVLNSLLLSCVSLKQ